MKAKADVAVDRLADPRETLDYSYQRQVELLAKVHAEQAKVRAEQAELKAQAGPATGRYDSLRTEERRLKAAAKRLEVTIGVLRARKEAIKATEAQRRVSEVCSSIFEEMDNAGMAAISDHRQREMLTQLLNSIKEMVVARERLDQQVNTLSPQQVALESQVSQALDIGRGDLAQAASARKAEIERQLSDLAAHCRWLG